MRFRDRYDAGRRLGERLLHLRSEDPIVLGLPRGGVPVASEVARALDAPLDLIVVRKLGVPFQPELAMGAIGEGDVRVLNDGVIRGFGITERELARVENVERVELERRAGQFRGGRPMTPLTGRTVIVVDDGLATGATARAALHVARAHGARSVVLAVPVAPAATLRALASDADELVCVATPARFCAIGEWYDDFTQVSDSEVIDLLADAGPTAGRAANDAGVERADTFFRQTVDADVRIPAGRLELPGHFTLPAPAVGLVVFAHGSGSSRHSPRNRAVAAALNEAGLGTLLLDLLTTDEAADRALVFDIPLLAERLTAAIDWLHERPEGRTLGIGSFGASTGAAAALWAAAEPGSAVRAVVSRGGRPDLAGPRLERVTAPTLLVVGGADTTVLRLNEEAAELLHCEHRLEVVEGATHLFEEPGALEAVARLATTWFVDHLAP